MGQPYWSGYVLLNHNNPPGNSGRRKIEAITELDMHHFEEFLDDLGIELDTGILPDIGKYIIFKPGTAIRSVR